VVFLQEDDADSSSTVLTRRNQGLLLFAERDYKGPCRSSGKHAISAACANGRLGYTVPFSCRSSSLSRAHAARHMKCSNGGQAAVGDPCNWACLSEHALRLVVRLCAYPKMLTPAAEACAGAAAEFQAVLEARPTDAAAANNLAVCRLHACDLPGAVMGIEAAVKADPGSHLREVVLTNLCAFPGRLRCR